MNFFIFYYVLYGVGVLVEKEECYDDFGELVWDNEFSVCFYFGNGVYYY